MARGTFRATATAVLGLIALQAVSTKGGSGRVAELLTDANSLVERVLDPSLPAIPDLRNGETWGRPATPTHASNSTPPQPRRAPTVGVMVPHF